MIPPSRSAPGTTVTTPGRTAAAAVVTVGLLALAGCGTVTTTGGGAPGASGPAAEARASASPSAAPPSAASAAEAGRQQHDRQFPEVAARCKDAAARTSPSTTVEPEDPRPTDPEAAKYAENHAFKTTVRLTPDRACTGSAHAERIRQALTGSGTQLPTDEAALARTLQALGYPTRSGEVYRSGGALGFAFAVPGTGPCVTGTLGTPVKVESHGPYVEGGCQEPRGGH
ncbi:hypothetical protein [Streptomyces sp. WAC06614]|uniref:hypothetical protein n=1 Tax=Streptomyces sp. WAC06614 TaxID=2487416 RepID=UPI000F78C1F0|nr:hypothetical protein [Streptomyces sp. WAC06614]RSS68679.1 hypothetical protein EF918_28030 [Streptomyces sp. WAC06614]